MSNTQQQIPATMFAELVVKAQQWAAERNFYAPTGATYEGQWLKLMEECGELAGGLARNKQAMVEDAIGDILVVLAVLDGFPDGSKVVPVEIEDWVEGEATHKQVAVPCGHMKYERLPHSAQTGDKFQSYAVLTFRLNILYIAENPAVHRYAAYEALLTIAESFNLTLDGCFLAAYNEIKDRKGVMYNGVFIKDTDPRYAELTGGTQVGSSAQDIGCSAIDVRSMQEDDIVDN